MTSLNFIQYILDQLSIVEGITAKKMFGEYGIFWKGKMIAIVADDQLFFKQTITGKNILKEVLLAPPYPGAKEYFLIEDLENITVLKELIECTFEELPFPTKKNKKKA